MDSVEIAKYLLDHNKFMVVATANESGKPWISPVGFVYDDSYNLYWVSSKQAIHSENIRNRPEVAISIYGQTPDGKFDGLYIDAKAVELTSTSDIGLGIRLFKEKNPQPSHFATNSPSEVTNDAEWRMYQAKPVEIFKRADDTINDQAITVRQKIQLP